MLEWRQIDVGALFQYIDLTHEHAAHVIQLLLLYRATFQCSSVKRTIVFERLVHACSFDPISTTFDRTEAIDSVIKNHEQWLSGGENPWEHMGADDQERVEWRASHGPGYEMDKIAAIAIG